MTRELRGELRSLKTRIEDGEALPLDEAATATVHEGLTADAPKTQGQALRLLDTLPDGKAGAIRPFLDDLADVLEAAVDDPADRERRNAETAARVLSTLGAADPDAIEPYTSLGERLIKTSGPNRRTAGATLLSPLVVRDRFTVDADLADALARHVFLTDQFIDEFTRRVDCVSPAFILLGAAAEDHSERIVLGLSGAALEEYMTSPFEKPRHPTVRLLAELAASEPAFVERYCLELTTRLRDDSDQVVLNAGQALATLADEQGPEHLRPLTHVLPAALEHDAPAALAGTLTALEQAADARPDWLGSLPLDAVDNLREREVIADEVPLRARIVAILGQAAAVDATDEGTAPGVAVGPSLVEFATGTVATGEDPRQVFAHLARLRDGLAAAATADPDACVPALAAAGADAPVPDGDLGSMFETVADWLSRADDDGTVFDEVDAATPGDGLLQAVLVTSVLAEATGHDATVRSRCLSAAADPDRSTRERWVLGFALVMTDRDAFNADDYDRLETVRERFRADGDQGLATLADDGLAE
jgi:hypothetical protein